MKTTAPAETSAAKPEKPARKRPVAVIDVGSTSIRMAIAEIDDEGNVETIERLSQAVNLGKDTFTRGSIQKATIEDCARVLRSYRRILEEYGVTDPQSIRVVATSAVREATNRLAFIDRIYIATGFDVEPLDEADVNRMTYLGIQSLLKWKPSLKESRALVTEVGGGSTEVLMLQAGDVISSHTYRLGSLRLRETLQGYRAPVVNLRKIMESQIDRTVEQIVRQVSGEGDLQLIALGGDVRFAATQLLPDWNRDRIANLTLAAMEKLTGQLLNLSPDELVQRYHLRFPDAESLVPALLIYLHLGRALKLKNVLVANVNLRDGVLREMAAQGVWTENFANQIIRSGLDLGRRFQFDEAHSRHVADLSRHIFRAMTDEHRLDSRYELILYMAALLHEIGWYVNNTSHHKHSMYLINNSELFGLSKRDQLLVALVARYHRRASPKPTHPGYSTLSRDNRIAVCKMAAILRLADALDRSHSQRVKDIQCHKEEGQFVVAIPQIEDLSMEQLGLKQKGPLFEETFGLRVILRKG